MLSAKHPKNNLIDLSTFETITQDMHAANPRTALSEGDVIISTVGTIGNAAVVTGDVLPANSDRHIGIIRTKAGMDPFYLSSFLVSRHGRIQTLRESTGNVQQNLFISKLNGILVPRFPGSLERVVSLMTQQAYELHRSADQMNQTAELRLAESLCLNDKSIPGSLTYERTLKEVRTANRLDAQYYDPKYAYMRERLALAWKCKSLLELGIVEKGWNVDYADGGSIQVVRSGDLSNLGPDTNLLRSNAEDFYPLETGDVLISCIGFGSIGKVHVFDLDGRYATVSEVTVLRQRFVDPYYLATFLRSEAGQLQLEQYITGATGQLHLYPKDVCKVIIPILSTKVQQECRNLSILARQSRQRATGLLERAKRAVDIGIEQSEMAALAYLKEQ